MRYSLTPLVLVASVSAATIKIHVGDGGYTFSPSSTTAAVGDKIEFHFYDATGSHSVAEASFNSPCVPSNNAFFSGILSGTSTGSETFTVDVTSTDPIWYYCSMDRHCQAGMVGVINPPSGQSQSSFASKAANVPMGSAPSEVSGGVLGSAGSSPSSSPSSSASPSPSPSSSHHHVASTTSSHDHESSTTPAPSPSSTESVAASVSSAVSSVSRSVSSAASSASSAAAASTSAPSIAGRNDGKVAGALAAVAGGLVVLLA